MLIKMIITNVI